ncbi:hypothetical protein F5888DRAFT_1825708 [Russula emetica]|nr:hypothetical protein F5888DRAFT_1825708 [Russula emetica]
MAMIKTRCPWTTSCSPTRRHIQDDILVTIPVKIQTWKRFTGIITAPPYQAHHYDVRQIRTRTSVGKQRPLCTPIQRCTAHSCPVIRHAEPKEPALVMHSMKWGLVPHWSKAEPPTLNTINTRAENLQECSGMWGSVKGRKCRSLHQMLAPLPQSLVPVVIGSQGQIDNDDAVSAIRGLSQVLFLLPIHRNSCLPAAIVTLPKFRSLQTFLDFNAIYILIKPLRTLRAGSSGYSTSFLAMRSSAFIIVIDASFDSVSSTTLKPIPTHQKKAPLYLVPNNNDIGKWLIRSPHVPPTTAPPPDDLDAIRETRDSMTIYNDAANSVLEIDNDNITITPIFTQPSTPIYGPRPPPHLCLLSPLEPDQGVTRVYRGFYVFLM